ncbi:hypothetical protein FOVSG1_004435 [Fusarium oxysporum f. sp. vasinfectum]
MAVSNIITELPLRMPSPILVTALAACLIIVIFTVATATAGFIETCQGLPIAGSLVISKSLARSQHQYPQTLTRSSSTQK